jgi:histone deacetylase 1/2
MVLTPHKYAHHANMKKCGVVTTPMLTTDKLSRDLSVTHSPKDAFNYRSVIGGLQYLILTRPGLSFTVNKVCQFLSHPIIVHHEAVKRIPWYV